MVSSLVAAKVPGLVLYQREKSSCIVFVRLSRDSPVTLRMCVTHGIHATVVVLMEETKSWRYSILNSGRSLCKELLQRQ